MQYMLILILLTYKKKNMIKKCVFCGNEYNVTRGCVVEKRRYCSPLCKSKYWLINGNKSGKFIGDKLSIGKKIKETQSLSKFQTQFVYGTLLGDASLDLTRKGSASLRFQHTEKNLDYVILKMKLLENFVVQDKPLVSPPRASKPYNNRIFYSKKSYIGKTVTHQDFDKINKIFYIKKDGKRIKIFHKSLYSAIDYVSLLFWYMDDGCYTKYGYSNIHTNNFSYKENIFIKKMFNDIFDISASVYYIKSQNKYFIRINKDSTNKLMRKFSEYSELIPKSMQYKFTFFNDKEQDKQ